MLKAMKVSLAVFVHQVTLNSEVNPSLLTPPYLKQRVINAKTVRMMNGITSDLGLFFVYKWLLPLSLFGL